ncbi:hypothetical protein NX059_009155 [Plenodomus lindquistii]|nr:hypothetical protein NX059_009155 [Plenodomus lindquistii]
MGLDREEDLGRGSVSAKRTVGSEDRDFNTGADEFGETGFDFMEDRIGIDPKEDNDDASDTLLADDCVEADVLLLQVDSRLE